MVRLTVFSILIMITALLWGKTGNTQEISGLETVFSAPDLGGEETFIAPNERDPQSALTMLNEAGPGVYLAVGTERGFMSVALAHRATSLLLVDIDPNVVFYNNINIALLKVAIDREDYLNLRLTATSETWRERALQASPDVLPSPFRELLQDERSWSWWSTEVREEPRFRAFHNPSRGVQTFENANYLFSDTLFARLKLLALTGRIQSARVDLSDPVVTNRLFKNLERAGETLSVLDISNAWAPRFMTPQNTLRLLMQAGHVVDDDSILLYTYQYFDPELSGTPYFIYGAADWNTLADETELTTLMTHWEMLAQDTHTRAGFGEMNGHRLFSETYQAEQAHRMRHWSQLITDLQKAYPMYESSRSVEQVTSRKQNIFHRLRKSILGQPTQNSCRLVFGDHR